MLRTGDDALAEMVSVDEENEPGPALTEVETALVRYAVEELGGAFKVGRLYDALGERISHRQIVKRSQTWERRGWLTEPQRNAQGHPIGRQVTDDLRQLAGVDAPADISPAPGQGER